MSVAEKMTAIADAIREKTGGTDLLTLDGMAAAIPEVFAAGVAEAEAACAAKHFVGSFVGDGTRVASFEMPFKPDILVVSNFSSEIMNTASAIASVHYNGYTGGTLHAYGCVSNGGNYYMSLMTASSVAAKLVYADGVMTVQNIGNSTYPGFFYNGAEYAVIGVKLTNEAAEPLMFGTFALRRPEDSGVEAEWEETE